MVVVDTEQGEDLVDILTYALVTLKDDPSIEQMGIIFVNGRPVLLKSEWLENDDDADLIIRV